VSRQIFQSCFSLPQLEVRLLRNQWYSCATGLGEADALWTSACGKKRWRGIARSKMNPSIPISSYAIASSRTKRLIERMRSVPMQLAAEGADPLNATGIFDENVLTIGSRAVLPL